MDFEWDPQKARDNLDKHGVSFTEATELFGDNLSSTVADPDHSRAESRHLIFGRSGTGRYIVACFTERDDSIRLISARAMTRRERRAYEG